MSDPLADLVAAAQNACEIKTELERLRRIEAWALASLHVREGAVVLTEAPNTDNGWKQFKEVLIPGCTGTLDGIWLARTDQKWFGYFTPDVQWTVNDQWGRRKETRPATFMMPLRVMRARTDTDEPLTMPADATDWGIS